MDPKIELCDRCNGTGVMPGVYNNDTKSYAASSCFVCDGKKRVINADGSRLIYFLMTAMETGFLKLTVEKP